MRKSAWDRFDNIAIPNIWWEFKIWTKTYNLEVATGISVSYLHTKVCKESWKIFAQWALCLSADKAQKKSEIISSFSVSGMDVYEINFEILSILHKLPLFQKYVSGKDILQNHNANPFERN